MRLGACHGPHMKSNRHRLKDVKEKAYDPHNKAVCLASKSKGVVDECPGYPHRARLVLWIEVRKSCLINPDLNHS